MNIQHQNWTPDTCECTLEEEYDKDNINAVMTCSRVIKKCVAHQDILDSELYGVLYANPDGENKRKNQLHRILLGYESVKGLGLEETKINPDGSNAGLGFKNGIEYSWSFEGTGKDRVLKAEIKGASLNAAQKNAIKALANTKFGIGKVEIL